MSAIVRHNGGGWMPSIFNDLLGAEWLPATLNPAVTPAINVKEGKDAYTVEVAAPGMTKEDFEVHINGQNDLVITMERKDKGCSCDDKECSCDDKECHYLRREFSYTKFQQTMVLPDDVDRNGVKAECDKGILCIKLPKKPEAKEKHEKRMIEIH